MRPPWIRAAAACVLSAGPPGAGLAPVAYDLGLLPCGLDALAGPISGFDRGAGGGGGPAMLPCRVARIAVESDFEYTSAVFGGDAGAAAAYIATLFAALTTRRNRAP